MKRLAGLAAAAGMVGGLLYLGTVKVERGGGSWSTANPEAEFDVNTVEWLFGGYYFEFVWGWWPRR